MNHKDVLLIGVMSSVEDVEVIEAFCYTTNAPTNLWVGAICEDGSRMGVQFLAHFLNALIEDDAFNEGDNVVMFNQNGVKLTATVGEEVPVSEVQAFQALSDTVRKVSVSVG